MSDLAHGLFALHVAIRPWVLDLKDWTGQVVAEFPIEHWVHCSFLPIHYKEKSSSNGSGVTLIVRRQRSLENCKRTVRTHTVDYIQISESQLNSPIHTSPAASAQVAQHT